MTTNHTQDLSDVLVSIDCKLKSHYLAGTDLYPKTCQWAIAALERTGWSTAQIKRAIAGKQPAEQWPVLRMRLSPRALIALQGHLEQFGEPTEEQLQLRIEKPIEEGDRHAEG